MRGRKREHYLNFKDIIMNMNYYYPSENIQCPFTHTWYYTLSITWRIFIFIDWLEMYILEAQLSSAQLNSTHQTLLRLWIYFFILSFPLFNLLTTNPMITHSTPSHINMPPIRTEPPLTCQPLYMDWSLRHIERRIYHTLLFTFTNALEGRPTVFESFILSIIRTIYSRVLYMLNKDIVVYYNKMYK